MKIAEQEYKTFYAALIALLNKLAEAPEEDWRAAIAYEGLNKAFDCFSQAVFDATELPQKPPNFRHWREDEREFPMPFGD
jgi:hypothetical protein